MDLEKMVLEGRFREDLYYRINTVQMHLPALRDRASDILPLAEMFMKKYAVKYRREVETIATDAAQQLVSHSWGGNIRELQNVIEKAVILSEGKTLKSTDLSLSASTKSMPLANQTLEDAEEKTIRDTMARCNGNLSMVAKQLGISRPTLYSKLKKYDI